MLGLLQETPPALSSMIDHAATRHGSVEVVSRTATGAVTRSNYRDVRPRQRIASLAVNPAGRLELDCGVTGAAVIFNTINPRLFADQGESPDVQT